MTKQKQKKKANKEKPKMKITESGLKQIIQEELEAVMQEDGHEDVPSARRAMQTIIEDAGQMLKKLDQMEGSLPTWWTNKMAVASSMLNKMRDYLLVDGEAPEEMIKEDLEEEQAYYEMLAEGETIEEAMYRGRKVKLNKPMRGDVKKSKVYVKNAKGNVVKVNFGDKKMKIKKSNPKRRKSFRARHNCKNPGPKWKARYWSCKAW